VEYDQAVTYMQGRIRFGEKYGNERFEELLRRLHNPQNQFSAIHIAGTKGKGSTTTFAANILRTAGYRTGSYLSPYVYDLRERIQIDGEMIPKADFARWVATIRPHIEAIDSATDHGPITEFELKTAIAFCYFAEQQVDYAVVEVGLGGRLDATNVIPPPLVGVITNIGFDHVEILGNTLELIAAEKAGIIKTGSVCVTGIEDGPAYDTVEAICCQRDVPLIRVRPGQGWHTDIDHSLSITTASRQIFGLNLRLRGQFQHANAALAVATIDAAAIPRIDDHIVRLGLESAFAPGRLEIVQESSPTVILDSAHNELAARVLADSLVSDFRADDRPLILVVGMSHRHDPTELLQSLLNRLTPTAFVATEPMFRPHSAQAVADAATKLGIRNVAIAAPVPAAVRLAISKADGLQDAIVLVTGSFYTVGDIPPSMWKPKVYAD
jgi:dihydrofolate synthase/folylpolyglutamate synthase